METPQPIKRKYNKQKNLSATASGEANPKPKINNVVKTHIHPEAREILEKWMYDHRFYCYPIKDEKQLLASQTGLSIEKVSNWFINSRRRLLPKMLQNEGKSSGDFTITRKKSKQSGAVDKKVDLLTNPSTYFDVASTSQHSMDVYSDDGFDFGYQPQLNLSTIAETSFEYYDHYEYEEVLVPVTNYHQEAECNLNATNITPIKVIRGILYDQATQDKCFFLITY